MEKKLHLVYKSCDENAVTKKVLPLGEELFLGKTTLENFDVNVNLDKDLALFMPDIDIKKLLPDLIKHKISFTVLPHYEAMGICASLGVDSNLKKAIDFFKAQDKEIDVDILHCNGRPVFNTILVGDTFNLVSRKNKSSISLVKRAIGITKRFFRLRPFPVSVEFKDDKKYQTVAAGIIITQHRDSSVLSRLIPGDSFIREGMLHAFILSPRSFGELLKYTINSFFKKEYFPEFGAHIKTNKLTFICPEGRPLNYTEDGEAHKDLTLELEIKKKCIHIYPGEHLNTSKESKEPNEIYKTSSLPTGEAASELSSQTLPLIRSATTEEFKDLFMVLRDNAETKPSYLVLMVLATLLATFGLFANSTPVVIGAMILAPLMSPIITLSMATLRQDKKLIIQSGMTILIGMGVAFLFAVVVTLLTPISTANPEILSRIRPTILDLAVAVISGVAGAYAHAREEVAKTLAGVAIAVALVPPLAVSAIGFGWGDVAIFWGASLLLFTNLAGMVLAGALTFLFLGFSPFRLAQRGVLISFVTVAFLSIPLGFGFHQMVFEHNLIQKLDGFESQNVLVREVRVERLKPLSIAIKVISKEPLSTDQMDLITYEVESLVGQDVSLEINSAIIR